MWHVKNWFCTYLISTKRFDKNIAIDQRIFISIGYCIAKNLHIEHPLMINQGGYGVIIGVSSFGQPPDCSPTDINCLMDFSCKTADVAVYTKVSAYIPWIKETTGEGKHLNISPNTKNQIGKFSFRSPFKRGPENI